MNIDWILLFIFFLVFLILPRVEYEFFTYHKHAKNESSRISIFSPIVHFFPVLLILPHFQHEFFSRIIKHAKNDTPDIYIYMNIDVFPFCLFFLVLFAAPQI